MESMKRPNKSARPGYEFVERYMPCASEAEREEAHENLCAFVGAVLRVAKRIALEKQTASIRAKNDGAIPYEDDVPIPP